MGRMRKKIFGRLKETVTIACDELLAVFKDTGVMIIFFAAGLLYPILYSFIYRNETVRDIPVAVVDESHTSLSRMFIRAIDATPDVDVVVKAPTMLEARESYKNSDVDGIILIPETFSDDIHNGRQTHVSAFSNMASMLYFRAIYSSVNYVALGMGTEIQTHNLMMKGLSRKQAEIQAAPSKYEMHAMFNPKGGYASFLIPCVLVLIIQQTLVLGVGIRAGTDRENNAFHNLLPERKLYHGARRVVLGKALSYFVLYLFISTYNFVIIPYFFDLPHTASFATLMAFIIPYVTACVFFSMAISVFFYEREEVFVMYLFTTLPLLFMSGIPWPMVNMPTFWKLFSGFFPSTFGIKAFTKINSMGASLSQISFELMWLWIQAGVYFIFTLVLYRWQINRSSFKDMKRG
ncbi:MAG: ABC transporter permease [Paludibacteraceae bacterium]|nr:ABC transporter permease [Paludibacteraceae bacterium]MBP5136880.1 ABC transporter permease [Paludibacteraceae bacterium]